MDEEISKKENNQEEKDEQEESKSKPDNEVKEVKPEIKRESKVEAKEDVQEEKEKPKNDKFEKVKEYKNNLTDKMRKNPWVASTFLLGIFMLVIITTGFSGMTGGTVSERDIGEALTEFAKSQIGDIEILNVERESGLYKISYSSEQGNGLVYLTLDGKNLVQGVTPLDSIMQQNQESEGYSEESLEKISIFIDCLAEKDVKIYGVNWCGWTKKLVVETLGGFDVAVPIYVECTENQELCSSEGIEGYPTIKIDGELYEGSRTFEGFAEATGCPVPDVNNIQSSTEEATC